MDESCDAAVIGLAMTINYDEKCNDSFIGVIPVGSVSLCRRIIPPKIFVSTFTCNVSSCCPLIFNILQHFELLCFLSFRILAFLLAFIGGFIADIIYQRFFSYRYIRILLVLYSFCFIGLDTFGKTACCILPEGQACSIVLTGAPWFYTTSFSFVLILNFTA